MIAPADALGGLLGFVREEVARLLAEAQARPALVHQRNVEAIVGLPGREYLRLARAGVFASTKEKRLVIARTHDVVAVFETRMRARPENDSDETAAFSRSRSGLRRVAP